MIKNITLSILLIGSFFSTAHAKEALSSEHLQLMEEILEKKDIGFTVLEHRYLGDSVGLRFAPNEQAVKGFKLALPNGLKLSYGEILMFAGDIFGDPNAPISSCSTEKRPLCFEKQFNTLANKDTSNKAACSNPKSQVHQITQFYKQIDKEMVQARKEGIKDWEFYANNASRINQTMNRLTCGGSKLSPYFPFGQYFTLAQANFDHFAPDSYIAYKTGHEQALQLAIQGHGLLEKGELKQAQQVLELAYAKNAFASHFLTDSMAAGHIRTPRRALHDQIKLPSILKLLIANYMHNEDNRLGLNVTNPIGLSWRAYGDGYLFKEDGQLHRYLIKKVVQLSADSVFEAYQTGDMPKEYIELDYLPDLTKLAQLNNHAPLFTIDDHGDLLKRKKINDKNSYQWTKHWNGLLTLIEFKLFYKNEI